MKVSEALERTAFASMNPAQLRHASLSVPAPAATPVFSVLKDSKCNEIRPVSIAGTGTEVDMAEMRRLAEGVADRPSPQISPQFKTVDFKMPKPRIPMDQLLKLAKTATSSRSADEIATNISDTFSTKGQEVDEYDMEDQVKSGWTPAAPVEKRNPVKRKHVESDFESPIKPLTMTTKPMPAHAAAMNEEDKNPPIQAQKEKSKKKRKSASGSSSKQPHTPVSMVPVMSAGEVTIKLNELLEDLSRAVDSLSTDSHSEDLEQFINLDACAILEDTSQLFLAKQVLERVKNLLASLPTSTTNLSGLDAEDVRLFAQLCSATFTRSDVFTLMNLIKQESDLGDGILEKAEQHLNRSISGVMAASMFIALARRLPPEEFKPVATDVMALVNAWRHHLTDTVLFGMTDGADWQDASQDTRDELCRLTAKDAVRERMVSLALSLSDLLVAIHQLLLDDASLRVEENIITLSYAALIPFTRDSAPLGEFDPELHGKFHPSNYLHSLFSSIQHGSIQLLSWTFGKFTQHRAFLMDEILSCLPKLSCVQNAKSSTAASDIDPSRQNHYGCGWGGILDSSGAHSSLVYKFASGESVHSCTVLILKLISSCAMIDVPVLQTENGPDSINAQLEHGRTIIDSSKHIAHYALRNLLLRCFPRQNQHLATAQSPPSRKKNEDKVPIIAHDYRMILDGIVGDCLNLLGHPEVPATSILVEVAASLFLDLFDPNGPKWMHQDEASQQQPVKVLAQWKTMALENLAWIVSKTRYIHNQLTVVEAFKNALSFLDAQDELYQSAFADATVEALRFFQTDLDAKLAKLDIFSRVTNVKTGGLLVEALDKYGAGREPIIQECRRHLWLILQLNPIFSPTFFEKIVSLALSALTESSTSARSKSMRIVTFLSVSDPTILKSQLLKQEISARLMDPSSSVRDAAIELIGTAAQRAPREVIDHYYETLSHRILDTGVNVRKRVIRLMKALFFSMDSQKPEDMLKMTDCVGRILRRVCSPTEENSIRDLATRIALELLVCPSTSHTDSGLAGLDFKSLPEEVLDKMEEHGLDSMDFETKQAILVKIDLLSRICEDNSNLVTLFFERVKEKTTLKSHPQVLVAVYGLVESLMLRLVSTNDRSEKWFTTASVLAQAFPALFVKHITSFRQPFVDLVAGSRSVPELIRLIDTLNIFEHVLPLFGTGEAKSNVYECAGKSLDPAFLQQIENGLMSLSVKVSGPAAVATVKCLCACVNKVTGNFYLIARLMDSCTDYLTKQLESFKQQQTVLIAEKTLMSLVHAITLVGLLCRHFDFMSHQHVFQDVAIAMAQSPTKKNIKLDLFKSGQIVDVVFQSLIAFASMDPSIQYIDRLKTSAIISLGGLWITNPPLLIREQSIEVLNTILRSEDDESATGMFEIKAQTMQMFADFLEAEELKMQKRQKTTAEDDDEGPSLDVLKGQADEYTNTGLSGSLMQHYLDPILGSLFSKSERLRYASFSVVHAVLKQGLVHPLMCVPSLIALETLPGRLQDQAFALHKDLNEKHSSFIHNCDHDGVRLSFDARTRLGIDRSGHLQRVLEDGSFVTSSVFQALFDLVRDKRLRRRDFVNVLVKILVSECAGSQQVTSDLLSYAKFVAEGLSALDFKTIEEPMIAIHHINQLISTVAPEVQVSLQSHGQGGEDNIRMSMMVGLLIELKLHLKSMYGLSDSKCDSYHPSDPVRTLDKPANRRHSIPLHFDKMPSLVSDVSMKQVFEDEECLRAHVERFNELMEIVSSMMDGCYEEVTDAGSCEVTPMILKTNDTKTTMISTAESTPAVKSNKRKSMKGRGAGKSKKQRKSDFAESAAAAADRRKSVRSRQTANYAESSTEDGDDFE